MSTPIYGGGLGPVGPTGAGGAAGANGATGAAGSDGATAITSLGSFTQPAVDAQTAGGGVPFTGPQPLVGTTVVIGSGGVWAGYYEVASSTETRAQFVLKIEGNVAPTGTVGAGQMFYSGPI